MSNWQEHPEIGEPTPDDHRNTAIVMGVLALLCALLAVFLAPLPPIRTILIVLAAMCCALALYALRRSDH